MRENGCAWGPGHCPGKHTASVLETPLFLFAYCFHCINSTAAVYTSIISRHIIIAVVSQVMRTHRQHTPGFAFLPPQSHMSSRDNNNNNNSDLVQYLMTVHNLLMLFAVPSSLHPEATTTMSAA